MEQNRSHKRDGELFTCPECGLHYNEKHWAEKCEKWCREHHSCNLEITSHSMESKQNGFNSYNETQEKNYNGLES